MMKKLEVTKIETDAHLTAAFKRVDALWGEKLIDMSKSGELDRVVDLIEAYEDEHYPIKLASSSEDVDQ